MSVSGTNRPPKSRSTPHRPFGIRPPGGRRGPGVGPKGVFGRCRRASTRALDEHGDADRVLGRSTPARAPDVPPTGAARRRRRYPRRWPGPSAAPRRTLPACRPPARMTGIRVATARRDVGGGSLAGAAGDGRVGRVEHDGPQVGLGPIRLAACVTVTAAAVAVGIRGSPSPIGGQVERLDDRQRDDIERVRRLRAVELDRVQPDPRGDGGHLGRRPGRRRCPRAWAHRRGGREARQADQGRDLRLRPAPAWCRAPCSGRWRPRPTAMAAARPRGSVTPQILTSGSRPSAAGSCPGRGTAPADTNAATRAVTAAASVPARIRSSPMSAASKPSARQRRSSAGSRTPDSAMTMRSCGMAVRSVSAVVVSTTQRPQVAVVDADEARIRGQRGIQLPRVVDLDERLQAQVQGAPDQAREASRGVQRGEQQHGVGARGAQDGQLARVDHELLGQHRHRGRGAGGDQVIDASRRTSGARRGPRSSRRRPRRRRAPGRRRPGAPRRATPPTGSGA